MEKSTTLEAGEPRASTSQKNLIRQLPLILLLLGILCHAIFLALCFGLFPWIDELLQGLPECKKFRWIAIPYGLSALLLMVGLVWPNKRIHVVWYWVLGLHAPLMLVEGFCLLWLTDCSTWSFS